ncbi:hypothetical protein K490DRAFT_38896 [Saccharata proteae CBS 121410]|uniref:Trafficking protein particle complex II-specific subunit 65 IgD3 domain-containing protein n=1 Tax=Saccharata proteae CBS 121410 TaxID=1314787 RepID=A0A6A5YD84_9PEZI|nr:hypothetical protein K490DRAFT_38896 [Saccharata proteae CBS 121410]
MAASELPDRARTSAEFSECSLLEAVIPVSSSLDLKAALLDWDGSAEDDNPSVLPFLPQRQILFFDELIHIYVVLRTPSIDEITLKAFIARLALNVEAYAQGTGVPQNGPSHPAHAAPLKELLYSSTIKDSQEPIVLSHESLPNRKDGSPPYSYVAWELEVFLGHPRSRLYKPAISFSVAASLKSAIQNRPKVLDDEYLPSLSPMPGNLLEAMADPSVENGAKPHLSAARITKVAPIAPAMRELMRPLQNTNRRLLRAVPSLAWRIRYTKCHSASTDVSVIAAFDFEVTGVPGCSFSMDYFGLELSDGHVEPIAQQVSSGDSSVYKHGDQVVMLFKLTPEVSADDTNHVRSLNVRIRAQALVSEDCHSTIRIDWKTNVDFTAVVDSRLRFPAPQPGTFSRKNIRRPGNNGGHPPGSSHSRGSDALTFADSMRKEQRSISNSGIAVTISSPERVFVGEDFAWEIFVVNRSTQKQQFAISVVEKQPRDRRPPRRQFDSDEEAEEYEAQHKMHAEPMELMDLTKEVKTNVLAPKDCQSVHLEFLPMSAGVLSIEAVRFTDIETEEFTDVRDLPTVVSFLNIKGMLGVVKSRIMVLFLCTSPLTYLDSRTVGAILVPHGSGAVLEYHMEFSGHQNVIARLCDPPRTSNMIEGSRRRLLRALNRRYIYGTVPLLHALVFLLEMAVVSLLTRKFNTYYANRPVLTTMITNAVLGGIADTVAQSITAIRERAARKPGGVDKDDFFAIEIHELDKKNPYPKDELIPLSAKLPPPFDFERLTRFMAYGFLMAPVQHKWFGFLSRTFPITKTSAMVPALKRVAFDQLLFAPVGLACFFTFMTVAEGGGRRAVTKKFQDVYIPALKANFIVWPAVQILNFRVMPIQFQIPFVSTIGIAWTAYLSLSNASDEA